MEQSLKPSTTTILETNAQGSFAIEPLLPGYGSTLGNALRRVLLSSLTGAAVDYVMIDGVQHEFSTIPNVKEDVVEILLNLKGVRFTLTEERSELTLKSDKVGVVTASAFSSSSSCHVVNPDHKIATLNKGASLSMTIGVKAGIGYEPVEKKIDREKTVGMIYVDSTFSPVVNVSYKVENTRVGQMTNYDRLLLDIKTDSSVKPSEALKFASEVLMRQYQAIAGSEEVVTPSVQHEEIIVTEDSLNILHSLDAKTKVEDAGFSGRTEHALTASGYKTLAGLKRLSDIKIQGIKGLGAKGIEEVKAVLSRV